MRCPFCNVDQDRVIESRTINDGEVIRRRRECESCGERFTSYEYIEKNAAFVIKKDGRREPYDQAKLRRGILRAVEKRPIAIEIIDQMVQRIERKAVSAMNAEVSTELIGNLVMEELEKLDPVAYVRFASVYREFKSVHEFVAEISALR